MGINEYVAALMEMENIPFECPECWKPGILEKCQ